MSPHVKQQLAADGILTLLMSKLRSEAPFLPLTTSPSPPLIVLSLMYHVLPFSAHVDAASLHPCILLLHM